MVCIHSIKKPFLRLIEDFGYIKKSDNFGETYYFARLDDREFIVVFQDTTVGIYTMKNEFFEKFKPDDFMTMFTQNTESFENLMKYMDNYREGDDLMAFGISIVRGGLS